MSDFMMLAMVTGIDASGGDRIRVVLKPVKGCDFNWEKDKKKDAYVIMVSTEPPEIRFFRPKDLEAGFDAPIVLAPLLSQLLADRTSMRFHLSGAGSDAMSRPDKIVRIESMD